MSLYEFMNSDGGMTQHKKKFPSSVWWVVHIVATHAANTQSEQALLRKQITIWWWDDFVDH